jgi:hypothetical protein
MAQAIVRDHHQVLQRNISSSSTQFDQYQEEKSSVQKEELNSANLGKPDGPVS